LEWDEKRVDVKGKGQCQTYLLKEKHHINPLVVLDESADIEVHKTK